MDKIEIQNYINNFRRLLSQYLKPNVGLQSIVYQYDEGCVILFDLGLNCSNKDDYRSTSRNITEVLGRTNLFEKEHTNYTFTGTNILLVSNKILIIKDNNPDEWTIDKTKEDIKKILSPSKDKSNE